MLGQYTFGLDAIKKDGLTSSAVYLGGNYDESNKVPYFASADDAGAIDLKAGKQMYSLKARFNIFCLEDVKPVATGGTKGVITVTPTVTEAGAGTLAFKVGGVSYSAAIEATDTDAAAVVAKIKAAYDGSDWDVSGTSTAVFTQKEAKAYTYSADDWAATFTAAVEGTGAYSLAAAETTPAVAPTATGITFTLQHSDDNVTFADLISTKIPCEALVAESTPVFEITMPSNCKRYVKLKVQGDASATSGALLCAIEPKN